MSSYKMQYSMTYCTIFCDYPIINSATFEPLKTLIQFLKPNKPKEEEQDACIMCISTHTVRVYRWLQWQNNMKLQNQAYSINLVINVTSSIPECVKLYSYGINSVILYTHCIVHFHPHLHKQWRDQTKNSQRGRIGTVSYSPKRHHWIVKV